MPELPEAETIARVLEGHLAGRSLADAGVLLRMRRHGKCVIFDFGDKILLARLGMTGTFRLHGTPGRYTQQSFDFSGVTLHYDDIRKFGRLEWRREAPVWAPDVLNITAGEFQSRLKGRARAIKPLLLDQSVVAGIGNIYADECLFGARIHPLSPAATVDAGRLFRSIRRILRAAIAYGGSTISDFRDPLGMEGRYQNQHCVYGRAGLPCPRCGTPIVRCVVTQRGTHYCRQCQPAPNSSQLTSG